MMRYIYTDIVRILQDNQMLAFQNDPVDILQTSQTRATITNLSPCLSYWAVVTAVDCINRISSLPQLVSAFQPIQFELFITLEESVSCQTWVTDNFFGKISNVRNSVNAALLDSTCGLPLSCLSDSQFVCGSDSSKATLQ